MLILIQISICLIGGLMMSRIAKLLNLPAVTAYLVAGLLLGPFCIGALGLSGIGIGFGTLDEVASLDLISQAALGFIAFTIGNEFRLEQLKQMGSKAIFIGIMQAVFTTFAVDVALIILHFINPGLISISSAITLGAIAAALTPSTKAIIINSPNNPSGVVYGAEQRDSRRHRPRGHPDGRKAV